MATSTRSTCWWVSFGATMLIAVAVFGPRLHAGENEPLSIDKVKAIVEKVLARDPEYRAGDLVTQSQAAAALRELKSAGWEVPKGSELLKRVPLDDEFLVRALRNGRGVSFMRSVSAMPSGYDRVDRLSRIPNGQAIVRQLIDGPDGHKLIAYMTESRGGAELGKVLGRTANGSGFNEPTERIYTAEQLLAALSKLSAAQSAGK